MKIVIIQDFLRNGGTERQTILLANAFAHAGHDTLLITFRPGGALATTVSPEVKRRALQPIDLHFDWFAPGLARQVGDFSPDVVLCMGRMANCRGAGLRRSSLAGLVIGTMRTGKSLPPSYVASLRSAPHVIANSVGARDTLVQRYSVPAQNISVIHNSLVFPDADPGDEQHEQQRAAMRTERGAALSTSVLLNVAMFRPEKNQRELIDTVALLPANLDWQLWLVGDGPTLSACERRAAELNLGARIKFLGFQRDPSAFYAAADVAVHASATEALSNFIIEAQAHGLAAVVFAAQGMDECFIPDHTGWAIPAGRREDFRDAVVRLINASEAERATRSAAARAFARERFDPGSQAAAYLELFQRLVSPVAP